MSNIRFGAPGGFAVRTATTGGMRPVAQPVGAGVVNQPVTMAPVVSPVVSSGGIGTSRLTPGLQPGMAGVTRVPSTVSSGATNLGTTGGGLTVSRPPILTPGDTGSPITNITTPTTPTSPVVVSRPSPTTPYTPVTNNPITNNPITNNPIAIPPSRPGGSSPITWNPPVGGPSPVQPGGYYPPGSRTPPSMPGIGYNSSDSCLQYGGYTGLFARTIGRFLCRSSTYQGQVTTGGVVMAQPTAAGYTGSRTVPTQQYAPTTATSPDASNLLNTRAMPQITIQSNAFQ